MAAHEPSRARPVAVLILAIGCAATLGYGRFLHHAYPIQHWLVWRLLALLALSAALSLACVSAGHLLLLRVFRAERLPNVEKLCASFALGLIAWSHAMFLAGALGLFKPWLAVVAPLAFFAPGARPLFAWFQSERERARLEAERARAWGAWSISAALLGGLCVVVVYLGALSPLAVNFDAAWSHLPIAADYARHGRVVPFFADYARAMPQLKAMIDTWAFLVPGLDFTGHIMLSLHLELFTFVWTLASVSAMANYLLAEDDAAREADARSTWAAFFLFPAIFVYDSNLGGSSDHYVALFAAPAFLAATRAARSFAPRDAALAGALLGGALATKYQGIDCVFGVLAVSLPSALASVLRPKPGEPRAKTAGELLIAASMLAIGLTLVVLPHFAKNALFYRNPVYPFLQDIFGGRPTTPDAAFLVEHVNKDLRFVPAGSFFARLVDSARGALVYSFEPHYSFTKAMPVAGSLFTLSLPIVLVLDRQKRLARAAVASALCLLAWAMTFRVDRHLQTFLPLLVAVTAVVIVRAHRLGWIARAGVLPLVVLQLLWSGDALVYSSQELLVDSFELIRSGFDGALDRRDAYRQEFRAMGRELPANARVVLHHTRASLGLPRDVLLDWAGHQALIDYRGMKGPRALYDRFHELGVTHLVSERRLGTRPGATRLEDVLFAELAHHHGRELRMFGADELVALGEAPEPDHGYRVLTLGLGSYADGLYDVTAMSVYEEVDASSARDYPPPSVPLPRGSEARAALIREADCVLVGTTYASERLDEELARAHRLDTTFDRAFSIYLRATGDPREPSPLRLP